MRKFALLILVSFAVSGCAPKTAGKAEVQQRLYLGVREDRVEQKIVDIIRDAEDAPLAVGQGMILKLFNDIVADQLKDSASFAYLKMTELVSKYLYDPNSPLRDEDLYLPFVNAMAQSPYTSEDIRPAYEFEAQMCALNRRGDKVADFMITDLRGKTRSLYSMEAPLTILLFSNPGCGACRDIMDILSADELVKAALKDESLQVVNVYIDEDLEAWKEYAPSYPETWISGYEKALTVREGGEWYVRAIPSLYLLDAQKRVILKDPDVNRMMYTLYNGIR